MGSVAVGGDHLRMIGLAIAKLGIESGHSTSFGNSGFLQWLATIAAIYLLVLDRTQWRTRMQTSLLVPYIFISLPYIIFSFLRGDVGKWVAFITVVLHLFFHRRFPEWLGLPGSMMLLIVATPSFMVATLRQSIVGVAINLFIGAYLLQEHIKAAGGFRRALSEKRGISNTFGIILLFVSPFWEIYKAI